MAKNEDLAQSANDQANYELMQQMQQRMIVLEGSVKKDRLRYFGLGSLAGVAVGVLACGLLGSSYDEDDDEVYVYEES